jgi:hypothetical protein
VRARLKRRQQVRRLTILLTVVIIGVSLAVGVYFVAMAGQGSRLDSYDGRLVSSSDMASLVQVSGQPYGLAAPATMQGALQKYGGTPFVSAGKPSVVYVGGEFCPFCAVERWSLIMALMRFGSFSNLHYTTSANTEGDYATFTFVGSSYSSQYISFRPYEVSDRSRNTLQTVPSNYSAIWQSKANNGVPFVDFGNAYLLASSVPADPTILQGKNWTSILTGVSTSDSAGVQIREAANLFTAVICKLTQGAPAAVCGTSPINAQSSSISAPSSAVLSLQAPRASAPDRITLRPAPRRLA